VKKLPINADSSVSNVKMCLISLSYMMIDLNIFGMWTRGWKKTINFNLSQWTASLPHKKKIYIFHFIDVKSKEVSNCRMNQ